ncbi:enoyl-CoA hydratase/isomerase family protein [Chromobacterium sp. IIBBL 290-4]|uniref:enoyl-CoA hydratase/isomerase family protein n=1 Tax=Chromobacterium sp. IIBBL 290-4 TaxID=2953890 RepID=UPI0020B8C215|nr:enoyl-CoA hydratase/isomerase family protein [Chromobacterium sp. IIBBL 290-4]UTH72920.1 enoyl-CoA hydratase/isomerase family protein [Chromobacterium sp. IIBBL 290-4]
MSYTMLQIEQIGKVATVWLNRPELHNALNEVLIAELTEAMRQLNRDEAVRVIVLAGRGKSFCAGADLDWMRRAAGYSEQENLADAQKLAAMLKAIYRSAKPVIARIHGAAMAGGTGLAAVCDIAIATDAAKFALTEVRLGLIPATIGPYVADAIGWRQARRYFLSAERIAAAAALQLGLVHELVSEALLDARVAEIAEELAKGAPGALREAKQLLAELREGSPWDDALLEHTAGRIASIRAGDEAREGLASFFEKRAPKWQE